jgi:hypothetical protein
MMSLCQLITRFTERGSAKRGQVAERIGEVQVDDVETVLALQLARERGQRGRQRDAENCSIGGSCHCRIAVPHVARPMTGVARNEIRHGDVAARTQRSRERFHMTLDAAQRVELAQVKDLHRSS